MRVIEPYQLRQKRKPKTGRRLLKAFFMLLAILIIVASSLGAWIYKSPLPPITAQTVDIQSKGTKVSLPWPSYGQSAIGAVGYGLLETTGNQTAVPTASVAKVMTAISILKAKPLAPGEQGPLITLSAADVDLYNQYLAEQGTVVPVVAGEQISEHQALEAMLLPSANNMADSLAIWAFGSISKYSDYANNLAKQLGLNNTTITSASGFPPTTVSTANDLVHLGLLAMNDPVIVQIVSQKQATIPVAGQIHNVNFLLGSNGVIGIKTGNTDQAGGVYLFAANHDYGFGKVITLVGAVMGAKTLGQALQNSQQLINSSFQNFSTRTVVQKGAILGYYNIPWAGRAAVTAAGDLTIIVWNGQNSSAKVYLGKVTPKSKTGNIVGEAKSGSQSVKLVLGGDIPTPTNNWRLKRKFD